MEGPRPAVPGESRRPMFSSATRKGTPAAAGGGSTRLGEGSHWQGEVRTGATPLCVEGTVEGTILSEGQVTIAATGLVKGAIHAKGLSVHGRAEGIFRVEACLEIHATGWVEGEVELGALMVDQGGVLQGTCRRLQPPAVKEPVPLVPRRDDRALDRPAAPASGTHGPHDAPPPGRGPGWMRP